MSSKSTSAWQRGLPTTSCWLLPIPKSFLDPGAHFPPYTISTGINGAAQERGTRRLRWNSPRKSQERRGRHWLLLVHRRRQDWPLC